MKSKKTSKASTKPTAKQGKRHWRALWLNDGKGGAAENPKNPTRPTRAEMIIRCDFYEARMKEAEERFKATIEGKLEEVLSKIEDIENRR